MSSKQGILVKCGGFSSQLARRLETNIDNDPLWGSRFDATQPEQVLMTHLEFLQNGADIILSNTYQASVEGYMKYLNLTKEESINLMRKSVKLAKDARIEYKKELQNIKTHKIVIADREMKITEEDGKTTKAPDLPLVLASIGPYGAHLHDGSEYDGSYAERVTKEELQKWHQPRIEACIAEGVDGLAIETIPCQKEAEAVVEMILQNYADVKFWVSFQCKDESSVAHGEKFSEAALAIWKLVKDANAEARVFGIGCNCVNPKFVSPLFKSLLDNGGSDIPLIVYSNSGERYDGVMKKWESHAQCEPLESFVPGWIQLGVRIIGGCCRVYPEDIAKIRKYIDNFTSTK